MTFPLSQSFLIKFIHTLIGYGLYGVGWLLGLKILPRSLRGRSSRGLGHLTTVDRKGLGEPLLKCEISELEVRILGLTSIFT